ncbi:MAG: hypothetical protein HYZ90_00820 [Candidatus Omnitrophica bacterium]|nr:hypothetical protein [Candidatus Omnitrophota bacterium]
METVPRLDYENLLASYEDRLTKVLRGFRPTPEVEFLETWVPDDDPARSILNLIEAAKERNLKRLTVTLGHKTLQAVDFDRLTQTIGSIARVMIERTAEGAELRIHLQDSHSPLGIHPAYQEGLQRFLNLCVHEGTLEEEKELILVQAEEQGVLLTVLVDPSTQLVRKAAYRNAATATQKGLLEGLCRLLVGRPLQEGSDHAVLRLQEQLRDKWQSPPVSGVIAVMNADPAFGLPLRLVRSLMKECRRKTELNDTKNFYDEPVSPSWGRLSQGERASRLAQRIHQHPSGGSMRLVHLEGTHRVVVEFNEPLDNGTKRRRILEMEEHLKANLEPTLQVYLQPKMDQNKPRQPKGVQ